MKRIEQKFAELKSQKRSAFVAYLCAGDPDYKTSLEVLKSLPKAGCDIIEIGVPFLDPSGDGPVIENAAKRAIAGGMTLKKVLQMAAEFRKSNDNTPLILMSYYNPLLKYGLKKIFSDAEKSGFDGVLIVDLPLEENEEIAKEISRSNLDLINLIAPTTNAERAKKIAKTGGGFLYLISMLGITGTKLASLTENKKNLQNLRKVSDLPVVIGFGIQTPDQAQEFSKAGFDGMVVGSTIVKEINKNFTAGKSSQEIVTSAKKIAEEFSKKIRGEHD